MRSISRTSGVCGLVIRAPRKEVRTIRGGRGDPAGLAPATVRVRLDALRVPARRGGQPSRPRRVPGAPRCRGNAPRLPHHRPQRRSHNAGPGADRTGRNNDAHPGFAARSKGPPASSTAAQFVQFTMCTPRGGPLSSDSRYDPPGHTPAALPPPPYISAPMTRRFTRLAWTAAIFTYLLIILGAIVRITGSGLGCGEHWPLCNGKLLPPLDLPTLIEYGHRLVAAGVSVLVTALAAYAW